MLGIHLNGGRQVSFVRKKRGLRLCMINLPNLSRIIPSDILIRSTEWGKEKKQKDQLNRWSRDVPGQDLNSRPRAYELAPLCALKNAGTYGINNSILGHFSIYGGVFA